MDFKVGDEIWWFIIKKNPKLSVDEMINFISPGDIELVHDEVVRVDEDAIHGVYSCRHVNEIWGKSRKEAWSRLKKEIEKWGPLE